MVVVGAPALPERAVGAVAVAVVEVVPAVDLYALHGDAKVLLPLGREVSAHGLVERVRVVGVDEPLDFGAVRIPGLVLGLGRDRVELLARIGPVAEVAIEPFADQPAGGRPAAGAGRAKSVGERVPVDRRAERVAPGAAGVDPGE